ncbi:hypothetical protein JR316_0005313 [Psilocybe cubensis]|uniref:Uncharacterized protein n=1 Tax=Psilocybe cubensis TaxID=181762 RepID=A0ACB8H658_PSICU|nr:hypothetical protein JR316_0005313 [Psilocybe cubensis]KAH9483209.1 hypothetical protein JR316_0005313 [Psilocybe cubensis]
MDSDSAQDSVVPTLSESALDALEMDGSMLDVNSLHNDSDSLTPTIGEMVMGLQSIEEPSIGGNSEPSIERLSHDIDQESASIGEQIFSQYPKSWDSTICSRVIKDIFHVFNMFHIVSNHGLRIEFARQLRDAIFIPDANDRANINAWGAKQTPPVTFEQLRSSRPKWLWRRCKRIIPSADILYDLLKKVFQTFGPLKDATTGVALFNFSTWKTCGHVLDLARCGFLSDPPGIPLYVEVCVDSKAPGLTIYRCLRGTNMTEGGVHTHLRSHLPTSGASVEHVHSCISDFVLRHNLIVGTFNSTGQRYRGHFSIWLTNSIQERLEYLRDVLINPLELTGWVNGNLYMQTSEVLGILPIPLEIRTSAGMTEYTPSLDRRQKHAFLAQMQKTRKPILPVHNPDEKQLFRHLMQKNPEYNSVSSGPIWKEAVKVWNHYADTEPTISYKLIEQLKSYYSKWKTLVNSKETLTMTYDTRRPLALELTDPTRSSTAPRVPQTSLQPARISSGLLPTSVSLGNFFNLPQHSLQNDQHSSTVRTNIQSQSRTLSNPPTRPNFNVSASRSTNEAQTHLSIGIPGRPAYEIGLDLQNWAQREALAQQRHWKKRKLLVPVQNADQNVAQAVGRCSFAGHRVAIAEMLIVMVAIQSSPTSLAIVVGKELTQHAALILELSQPVNRGKRELKWHFECNKHQYRAECEKEIKGDDMARTTTTPDDADSNHILKNVSVLDFVQRVWGVETEQCHMILNKEFKPSLCSLRQYQKALDRRSDAGIQSWPELRQLFREMATVLIKDVCDILSIDHKEVKTRFLDGYETRDTAKDGKPDLLNVYIPVGKATAGALSPKLEDSDLAEGTSIPEWSEVRAFIEFKQSQISSLEEGEVSSICSSEDSDESQLSTTSHSETTHDSEIAGDKRSKSSDLSMENRDAKKRCSSEIIPKYELQLADYAQKCLATGYRHYVTGIFIDGFEFWLWYYDRSGAMRCVGHNFSERLGMANLALALFAPSQSDMKHAGFDPFLYAIRGDPDLPVKSSEISLLIRPAVDLMGQCYKFTKGCGEKHLFFIKKIICLPKAIHGRGTVAVIARHSLSGQKFSDNLYALKLSWQQITRRHEGDIIKHLRNVLLDWRDHLPGPVFHTTVSAAELSMPRQAVRKSGSPSNYPSTEERDTLHVIATSRCKPLWQAKDVEEFKQAFLDCVECHYHAYKTGRVLHRDISEKNLMIYQPEKTDKSFLQDGSHTTESTLENDDEPRARGILNDFDMAAMLGPDDKPISTCPGEPHNIGTLTFMARDLLTSPTLRRFYQEIHPTLPDFHLYRHDLESFFYVLIWAATRYDLAAGKKRSLPENSPLLDWCHGTLGKGYSIKIPTKSMMLSLKQGIRPEWKGVWIDWIEPLYFLFQEGYRCCHNARTNDDAAGYITGHGNLTFEKFMDTIKVVPRNFGPKE